MGAAFSKKTTPPPAAAPSAVYDKAMMSDCMQTCAKQCAPSPAPTPATALTPPAATPTPTPTAAPTPSVATFVGNMGRNHYMYIRDRYRKDQMIKRLLIISIILLIIWFVYRNRKSLMKF